MAVATVVGKVGQAAAAKAETAIHKTKLTILMSGSYTTGGEAVDLTSSGVDIGLANVRHVTFGIGWGGYTPIWDETTGKVLVERTGAVSVPRVEETAAVDVGAVVTAGEMFITHD